MDFVAHLVAALAWLAAAVVIAFVFRKPIAELIGNITKFKIGSLEGEVRKELKQLPAPTEPKWEPAAIDADAANQLPAPAELALPAADSDVIQSAPSGAVVEAWSKLEDSLRDAVRRLDLRSLSDREPTNALTLAKRLLNAEAIDSTKFETIMTLRQLRNRIVHSWAEASSLSADVAAEFVRKAGEVDHSIRVGRDRLRTEALLGNLGTEDVKDVAVWPLALVGIGEDRYSSTAMAQARVGRWGARFGQHYLEISAEDAAMLINRGAEYQKANSPGDHELAGRALAKT